MLLGFLEKDEKDGNIIGENRVKMKGRKRKRKRKARRIGGEGIKIHPLLHLSFPFLASQMEQCLFLSFFLP